MITSVYYSPLSYNNHVITMVNKAYVDLGFIKRWAKDFTDPYVTKQRYTSLVRQILEYGCVGNVRISKIYSTIQYREYIGSRP